MKTDTHPTYNDNVVVTCACGATHPIGSTLDELKVEICSQCHPFYTGNEKVMDTAGRVDKFKKRMEQAAAKPAKKKAEPAPAPEVKEEVAEEVTEEVVEEVVETTEAPAEEVSTEEAAETTDTEDKVND